MRDPVQSFRLGPAQAWSVARGGGFHYSSWDGKGKAEMSAKNCRGLEDSLRWSNMQGRDILQQVWQRTLLCSRSSEAVAAGLLKESLMCELGLDEGACLGLSGLAAQRSSC